MGFPVFLTPIVSQDEYQGWKKVVARGDDCRLKKKNRIPYSIPIYAWLKQSWGTDSDYLLQYFTKKNCFLVSFAQFLIFHPASFNFPMLYCCPLHGIYLSHLNSYLHCMNYLVLVMNQLYILYKKQEILFLPERLVRPFWSYPQIPQRPKPEIEQQNRSKTARKKNVKIKQFQNSIEKKFPVLYLHLSSSDYWMKHGDEAT